MKLTWPERAVYLLVVLIVVGEVLFHNPLRFNQTVQAAGLTMRVPILWTPVKNQGGGMLVALRREWVRSGTVDIMDRTANGAKNGPWTMEAARREQVSVVVLQAKDRRFSNPKVMDLAAGRFTAVCEEASFDADQALTCYIVGTPLQFSYLGNRSYEPDARKMLASLN